MNETSPVGEPDSADQPVVVEDPARPGPLVGETGGGHVDRGPRPPVVARAALLMYISCGINLAWVFVDMAMSGTEDPRQGTVLLQALLRTGLWVVVVTRMRNGRNRSRIILTVMTGISAVAVAALTGTAAVFVQPGISRFAADMVVSVLVVGLNVVALVFTYLPEANAFFRPRSAGTLPA